VNAEEYGSSRDQDPPDLRQGFRNVHVRKSNGGDNAVKRGIRKRQCFAPGVLKGTIRKALPSDRQAGLVDIHADDIIVVGDIRPNGTPARSTTQIENPH